MENSQVLTFEQLIAEAKSVADARTKKAKELSIAAVDIIQKFVEADRALKFGSQTIEHHFPLYANQSNFEVGQYDTKTYCTRIKYEKDEETGAITWSLLEARNHNDHYGFHYFKDFDSDYKFSFRGLIEVLEKLPNILIYSINYRKKEIDSADRILETV